MGGWMVTIQVNFPVDIDDLNYMITLFTWISLLVIQWDYQILDRVNPPFSCAIQACRSLCLRKSLASNPGIHPS